ncbi:hepatic lectin-like [Pristis pectinata]|uniref:hepatic lectin-like n=1 Tax=Pristis pectinata TaxID=685728 RepID=UPI00223E89A4|nr:hepatic lectin-like [Pristis pectinata]
MREVTGNFENTSKEFAELQAEISGLREDLSLIPPFNQWRLFNKRLHFFSSTKQTWTEAQKFCASMNSQLVVIHSTTEQEYIQQNTNREHWIGLHDTAEEGTWRWVDGTDYASNVKFWARGQPNGDENQDEDCVVTEEGFWHDWPCSSKHPPICEKLAE